ncbi:MAG: tetratricopeptide repeat protein [Clostridia bacterium]|nr:tetratricopeptide repeat protein [Clostridia bacterium]
MATDKTPISPEDYAEPRCLLCMDLPGENVKPVPQLRIIEKLDEYMSRRDYAGAQRHLLYWLEEARLGGDLRGQLTVCCELVGHYRKTQNKSEALKFVDETVELLKKLGFEKNVSAGTAFVNAATACSAFGENERALELFGQAKAAYESSPLTKAELLGGLCNNMGLCYSALGKFDRALELFEEADGYMRRVENSEAERAITCLNAADTLEARDGSEKAEKKIFELVEKALGLLDSPGLARDGYYAFVCEKCAPGIEHHGFFADAERLKKISEEIYARNGEKTEG